MTAKQRAYHYKRALKMLQTGKIPEDVKIAWFPDNNENWAKNNSGMCELISFSYSKFSSTMCTESNFPELFMFKPKNTTDALWFAEGNRALRETILAFCIEITE